MSIIHSFDDTSEAVLQPSHLSQPMEGFPQTLVVAFDQHTAEAWRRQHPCEVVAHLNAYSHEVPVYQSTHEDRSVGFLLSPIGAPATVFLLENAIVKGARKILCFGSCGSLDRQYTDGCVLVPTHAYRDEGTSYHYLPAEAGDFVEVPTAARLAEILQGLRVPVVQGKTWTTDGIFRETRRNVQLRKDAGCIVVEMECAAVMALARFRGVEAYQFVYTVDNLDAAEWESHELMDATGDYRSRFARIALEAALRL